MTSRSAMASKRKNITGKVMLLKCVDSTALTRSSWHTDIKPDNILFVEDRLTLDGHLGKEGSSKLEEGQNKFKLADPGFAKFVEKSLKVSSNVPRQYLHGGTETYGRCCFTGHSL